MKNNQKSLHVVMRIFFTLLVFLPGFAHASVFKCLVNGKMVYQADPCPQNTQTQTYKEAPPGPPGTPHIMVNGQPVPIMIMQGGMNMGVGMAAPAPMQGGALMGAAQNPRTGETTLSVYCGNQPKEVCEQQNLQANLDNAIFQGDVKKVRQFLGKMKNVHYLSPAQSFSPFATAVEKGYVEIVNALLDKGADPLARDASGASMLAPAIERAQRGSGISVGMYQCLQRVLDRARGQGLLKPVFPLNASLAFAGKPDPVLLKFLLASGADPDVAPKVGYTATEEAIRQNRPDMLKMIFAAKPKDPSRNLDKIAYRAFLEKKPELLAMLRTQGGDHIRYIKNEPQALFDAIMPERKIEELAYILDQGVSPNTKNPQQQHAAAIFTALPFPDRLRLLIAHGADVNAHDVAGSYSVLSEVLFKSGQANYPALEMVRLLLDKGANPNGNHGGWGRYGALGATKREDHDIIALLLSRGATLSENEQSQRESEQGRKRYLAAGGHNEPAASGGGPVTLALDMERNDLALLILARDKKLSPQDKNVLPMAARRGEHELMQALLSAGADPNAADGHGMTAMSFASRRHDDTMMKVLAAAGAKPAEPLSRPLFDPRFPISDFAKAAAPIVDDVAFFDPPRFSIGNVREGTPFGFYGQDPIQPEQVKCERSTNFSIIALSSEAGQIMIGLCEREVKHVRDLTENSGKAIASILNLLKGSVPDSSKLDKLGWGHKKSTAPDGSEVHYFELIWISHGMGIIPTVVVFPRNGRTATIVQMDVSHLCDMQGMRTQTPLCSDPRKALTDIALRIQSRPAN